MTRAQLLDSVRSGAGRYARLDTREVAVTVYGDTAVMRGLSEAQAAGEAATPRTASFTLTLGNGGEGWKALALHSTRRD